MSNWVYDVSDRRLRFRRETAISRAENVIQVLSTHNVRVRVVGSLIENRFALHSDVDFLVEKCPIQLKYSIESIVESLMLDIPFDVIYQDEAEVSDL